MDKFYTSFELMKIFNINRGSWSKVKNELHLNDFGTKELLGKKERILYNEQAYNLLSDYYLYKNGSVEDNKSLTLIKIQSKEIEELKNISTTFQRYYEEEKANNKVLIEKNEDLTICNSDLTYKINQLELENQRLKNLSLFRRIFKLF